MDELQGGRKEEGKNHAFRKVAIGHRSTPGYKPGQPMNVEHTTMPPVLISWKSPAEERAAAKLNRKGAELTDECLFSLKKKGSHARPNRATTWDGNGSAHMHHLMKALQSLPSSKWLVNHAFPLPQNNAPHQPKARPLVGLGQESNETPPPKKRAGCRPRWSWEPTYTFLGLALPQHLKKMRAPKRNQPSLFKKALLGRRCLFTRTML
ncbi:hypothetical protein Lal_00002311 [Lupinus albus]|nr:hypothetical protein Lal_00002311 [Lupinus albus]